MALDKGVEIAGRSPSQDETPMEDKLGRSCPNNRLDEGGDEG